MEKQKIKSASPMANPNGMLVETYEGQKGSCWDKGLQMILTANIGKDVMIDIQKNDKGYNTVMQVYTVDPELDHAQEVINNASQMRTSNVEKSSGLSFRDEVIIAQVILKEANNTACVTMANAEMAITNEDYGKMLADNVNELTGAYKLALSNLAAL